MAPITIEQVRQKYPQYSDMSDAELGSALHKKFYSDMPESDFYSRIGLSTEPATPSTSLADRFLTGVSKAPSSLAALPGALYDVEKQIASEFLQPKMPQQVIAEMLLREAKGIATPEGRERLKGFIDVGGKTAAGIAGAGKGASLGAGIGAAVGGPAAPITGAVGGALGGLGGLAAGLLGYEELKDIAGVGTEETIPERLPGVAEELGLAAGTGALLKGGQLLTRGATGAGSLVQKGLERGSERYKKSILGVSDSDIVKGQRRSPQFLSKEGTPLTGRNAALEARAQGGDFRGSVEQAIEVLDEDGFFNKVGNTPAKAKIELEARKIELNNKANRFISQAEKGLKERALTGRPIVHKPNWGRVQEYIDEMADPTLKGSLQKNLDSIKKGWNEATNSGRGTLEDVINYRRRIGRNKDFKGTLSAEESELSQLRRRAYGELKETINKNYELGIAEVDPRLSGRFSETNKLLSAYKEFDDTVLTRGSSFTDIAKDAIYGAAPVAVGLATGNPIAGVLAGGGAAASRYFFPATSARALEKSRGIAEALTSVPQAGTQLITPLVRPEVLGATPGIYQTLLRGEE